jgi:very-short-patch-repair endonuclease
MGRTPVLPAQLLRGPFTVTEARRAGIERSHLRGESWTRLGRSTYVWSQLADDPMHRLATTLRRLPAGAAFSGLTAAWLHSIDVDPCSPIEATVPVGAGVSARSGVAIRRCILGRDDVTRKRGLPVTSAVRTIAEVCCRLTLTEAVVIADGALHCKLVREDQLKAWAESHAGNRGMKNLRRVLDLVEPATESPMESRLRMLLIAGGLPRPKAQVSIHDHWGRFVGRPDLYYEGQRLGIEYDGGVHRDMLAEDNRRQNKLLRMGIRLLRFTASDVFGNPDSVVRQVRELLAATAGSRTFHPEEFGPNAGSREN